VARTYDSIDERLAAWMVAQPLFFVATAPLAASGHVNCSPKGGPGSFAVLGGRRVAYQDLTGSGAETVAHLQENGRVVLMFCAFEGPPKIVRLHGRGEAVVPGGPQWEGLSAHFPDRLGSRAVISVEVERISTSCGYGVPLMSLVGERHEMDRWAQSKGADGLEAYRRENNAESLDGLPALKDVGAPVR
jgi:Pyridoxamine 5'-phosphate oxidase